MRASFALAIFGAVLYLSALAHADGGHVRLQQASGPFVVTLFTAPEPLTTGDADFSVLVQVSSNHQLVLDAAADLELRSPQGTIENIHLMPNQTGNRMLQSAAVPLANAGTWSAQLTIRRGAEQAICSTTFAVETSSSRRTTVIMFLIFPLFVVVLFLVQCAHRDRVQRLVQART